MVNLYNDKQGDAGSGRNSKPATAQPHALHYAPEFGGLSNHVPMALFALSKLGASNDHIRRYLQEHVTRLEKPAASSDVPIDESNFQRFLGTRKAYLGYFNYFSNKVTSTCRLPKLEDLAGGISAGAFHAVIRLAYGLEAEDNSEVAAGLAYLADAYQDPLSGDPFSDPQELSYTEMYRATIKQHAACELDIPVLKGLIFQEIQQVSSQTEIQRLLQQIAAIKSLTLEEIANCNLDLFLRTNDFTALHTVTAGHAVRVLLSFQADPESILPAFAAASIAAMLTIAPRAFDTSGIFSDEITTSALTETARSSDNDHDIKMVYSCLLEAAYYGDRDYLKAAQLWLSQKVS